MGEEVRMRDSEVSNVGDRARDWEMGLPSEEDLASLSHTLIPPNLAMAFSITPENTRTIHDVNLASETTLSSLRSGNTSSSEGDRVGSSCPGSDPKKQKTASDEDDGVVVVEEGDSGTLKRQRLVWTPQLHKRFVDVVDRLGIKNAVPKTIMELMNVGGLSRENVASHLQKYRLYLKRMQQRSTTKGGGGPSSYSSPVPMMQMPVYAHHMGMQGYHHKNLGHDLYHQNHHHNGSGGPGDAYMMHQNKFGSMASYPPVGGGSANEN